MLESKADRELLNPYVSELIQAQLDRIGMHYTDADTENDTLLRSTLLALGSRFSHPEVVNYMEQQKQEWIEKDAALEPNSRSLIYTYAIRNGATKEYEYALNLHNTTNFAEEKSRLAAALTSTEQPQLIGQTLQLLRSDTVRIQDVISWIMGLYRNEHAREQIWQWEQENWDWIQQQFGSGHLYAYFVYGLQTFFDRSKIPEIESFFSNKNTDGLNITLPRMLEAITWKSDWREQDQTRTVEYLKLNQ